MDRDVFVKAIHLAWSKSPDILDISWPHGGSPSDLVAFIEERLITSQMLLRRFLSLTSAKTSLPKIREAGSNKS